MALSALLFIGCVLIAYGPAAALLFGFVARRAQLLVLSVASAFVWLFALLLAAVLWIIVPPLKTTHVYGVIVGVLAQALLRWLFVKGYLRVEGRILDVLPRSDPMGVNDFSSAIAAGLGFGIMHAVVAYGSILGYSGHSQALYSDACSEMTLYLLSAVSGLVFSLGHVAWMVVAFDAERRQSRLRWIGTIALHAATALVTLGNESNGGCVGVVPAQLVVLIGSVAWAAAVVLAPDYETATQAVRRVPVVTSASAPSDGARGR